MLRVLLFGSPAWTDKMAIQQAIAGIYRRDQNFTLVCGDDKGAAEIAQGIWNALGGRVEEHPAEWRKFKREAGSVRNHEMIERGADECLVFLKGEHHWVRFAAKDADKAGIPITVHEDKGDENLSQVTVYPTYGDYLNRNKEEDG